MAKRKSLGDVAGESGADEAPQDREPTQHAEPQPERRPPKPKRLNVDLDPDFYDAVQAKASAERYTLSDLTRELFRRYLDGEVSL